MKKFFLLAILLSASLQVFSQSAELKVISSVVPKYPPTAKAVGATGAVELSAVIGHDGSVVSAEIISGHPLLRSVSRDAVLKWKFEKFSGSEAAGTATIAIYFGDEKIKVIDRSAKEREEVEEVTSVGANRFESKTVVLTPQLLILTESPHSCEIHDNEKMETEVLSVTRSPKITIISNSESIVTSTEPYWETKQEHFPNSWSFYSGNELNEATEKVEVRYCRTCRHNEDLWKKGHKFGQ